MTERSVDFPDPDVGGHDLLSQFGFAAALPFATVKGLGVPFPGQTVLITATLYASFTHRRAGG